MCSSDLHVARRYDFRGDRLFEYFTPVLIAGSVGTALLFLKWRALQSLGWRSWSLLLFKVASLHLIGSLIWIEAGRALFSFLASQGFRYYIPAMYLAAAFVIGFGFAVLWCIADQRRRCPVCLHRLILPLAQGSWASIFDPAATEFVCSEGHGALALVEVEAAVGPLERWTSGQP